MFQVGEICIFNKDNIIPMSSDKIIYVRILERKFSPFLGGRYYIAKICDKDGKVLNNNAMKIKEIYLTKINYGEVVVVRYPEDVPIINARDVALVKLMAEKTINQFEEYAQKDILKLISKLELFATVINEY